MVTTGTVVQPRPVQTVVAQNIQSQVNVVPRPVVVGQQNLVQTGFQSPSRVVENVTIVNRNHTQVAQNNVNIQRNVQNNVVQQTGKATNIQTQVPRNVTVPVQPQVTSQKQIPQVPQTVPTNPTIVQNTQNIQNVQNVTRNVVTQQNANTVATNQPTQQQRQTQGNTAVTQTTTTNQPQVPRQNIPQPQQQLPQQTLPQQQQIGQQSPSFVGQVLNWQVQQNSGQLSNQPQTPKGQQGQVLNWQAQQSSTTKAQQGGQFIQQNTQIQQLNKLHTIS